MSLDANPDVLLVRKHLVEHLGAPDEVFEVSGSPLPNSPVQALNLAYFAPAGPQSPVVFATCGASLYEMNDGRRVEAMMVLRREPQGEAFDAVHRLLASFALFAETNDEVVRVGDVVRAQQELSGFSKMDAILFMPPVPFVPSFHRAEITNGMEVELIWLLPVYEAEANYALEHGPQALMMLFAAQHLDLTEVERDEANTLVRPEDAAELAKKVLENTQNKPKKGPTPMQTRKLKSSRRDQGKGSFDVSEEGGEVRVARRGRKKKPAPPPAPAAPPRPAAPPPPAAPKVPDPPARRPNRPQARPIAQQAPKKDEVRFDLSSGALQSAAKKTQTMAAATPPEDKPTKPAAQAALDPEAAKKKRIEELKANAKAAAQRAAARESGEVSAVNPDELESATTEPMPAARDTSQARAAAKRRGAPKRVIRDKTD